MLSKQLGDGKHHLTMGDIGQNFSGQPVSESGHSFGMARGAKVSTMARKRQDHLMAALRVFTADAGESMAQVAAVKESIGHFTEDRSPEAVALGKAIVIHPLELIEVVFDQPIQRGGLWIPGEIDACDSFCHTSGNGRKGGFANLKE